VDLRVWTIGHSTRTLVEFVSVLEAHQIEAIVDVRRFPGSRRLPQFGSAALETALAGRRVEYQWLPALGGRRKPLPNSVNSGWRNESFRGYADHVSTEEFASGLTELLTIAPGMRTAIMCAEVLWWRCHRRVIADVLTSLAVTVLHIRGEEVADVHEITPPGHLVNGVLSYAAEGTSAEQLGLTLA
jgi:uncharacterized protein (DUF488 family)